MKKTLVKATAWASSMFAVLVANAALADTDYGLSYGSQLELGNNSPESIVIDAINWVLGILALVAVIMILVGGFKWMTAGGNEERVDSAKKLLVAALIGLVIILAAWGVSLYAVQTLGNVTGADVST